MVPSARRPADGIVVDVMAASVNGLGRDFVGRVVAVGADVDYIEIGMCVAGVSESVEPQQHVAVSADLVAPVPDGVDPVLAAEAGLAGITAQSALEVLGASDLGNLLICGPVSGAGGFALQLAKARGAKVAFVTSGGEAELARELGADVVIGEDTDLTRAIRRARYGLDGRVDTALHIDGDPSVLADVVRPGGRFTSVAGAAIEMTRYDIEYVPTVVAPSGHKLADLLFKVASRRLCQGRGAKG